MEGVEARVPGERPLVCLFVSECGLYEDLPGTRRVLTFDRVRVIPLGGDNLEVQRLGAPRGSHLTEDKATIGIGARDADDARGRHLGPRKEVLGWGREHRRLDQMKMKMKRVDPFAVERRLEGC
jgi:hypothetical protein